jgi:hypothetical protein
VNWQTSLGAPQGQGGTDYRHFPSHSYFIDPENIAQSGSSTLLEVPMSIQYKYPHWINGLKQGINALRGKKRQHSVHWLRPSGGNAENMKQVAAKSLEQGHDFVEFMLHSSEFMPGGSPTFKTAEDIEILYQDLESLFEWLKERTQGMTLAEYYQTKVNQDV